MFQLSLAILAWAAILAQSSQIPFIPSSSDSSGVKTFSRSHPAPYNVSITTSGYSSAVWRPFPNPLLPPAILYPLEDIKLRSVPAKVWRPRAAGGSPEYEAARHAHRLESRGITSNIEPLEWDEVEVEAPDVSDMDTLAGLAKMTSNAYVEGDRSQKNNSGWYHFPDWRLGQSFGWTEDGIRGHVFATEDNSTVVVAIKGTSAGLVGGGGSTSGNDKMNDNLFFSCCCARVDWSWSTVCDCYSGGWKCDETCVEDALIDKSVYYPHAIDLYNNITVMYPEANIWLTGHSLGGSLASMLSLTFGVPCVTFEAPGDHMPAKRLHLPMPPGQTAQGIGKALTHVYHTADPIPQSVYDVFQTETVQTLTVTRLSRGACVGSLSSCGLAGFALESRCHTGQTILFDVVNELHWAVDIRTHSIAQLIEHVLIPDWDKKTKSVSLTTTSIPSMQWPSWMSQVSRPIWLSHFSWPWGRGGEHKDPEDNKKPSPPRKDRSKSNVPNPKLEDDCVDCIKWDYGDYK